MTNTTNPDGALLRNLLEAYAVHGGSYRAPNFPAVAGLSVLFLRQTKSAAYRIATLEDGSRWLAVRYRGRADWHPVFAVAVLETLVADGWRVSHTVEVAS